MEGSKLAFFLKLTEKMDSPLPTPTPPVEREPSKRGAPDGDAPTRPQPKIIAFDSLSRCGDEVWIELEGQMYRLSKTRQGKLILTK